MNDMSKFTPEMAIRTFLEKVTKQDWAAFLVTLVAGFMAHGFMFLNKLPNGDDLVCWRGNGGGAIGQGRWLKAIFENFRMDLVGDYSTPWSKGCLSIFLFALAAILVVRIFQVESPVFAGLCGGLLVTFPTVGMAFLFMYMADSIALACLFTCLSAYFIVQRPINKWVSITIGIICGACAVGMYQAYFPMLATILLTSLLKDCLQGLFDKMKDWLVKGAYYICILAGVMVLYFAVNQILVSVMHVVPVEMHGSQMGEISVAVIPDVLKNMFGHYLTMFQSDYLGIGASVLIRLAMLILTILFIWNAISATANWLKEKKMNRIVSLWITILLYPMAVNMIYLMVPYAQDTVYVLMTHSLVFVFLLPLLTAEQIDGVLSRWVTVLVTTWAVLYYAHFSNEIYLFQKLAASEVYGYYTTLSTRIQTAEGYDPAYPVALIGSNQDPNVYDLMGQFQNLKEFVGLQDIKNPLLGQEHAQLLMSEWCGFAPEYMKTESLTDNMKESLTGMPSYPEENSIQVIDGVVLVKFSE